MQLSQDYLQPTCNHRFEPGLNATIKVKKTNVFLTATLVRLSERLTVVFQVKKLGKYFIVNLSNSEMSFLTHSCQY
jgi:hypothetical protein